MPCCPCCGGSAQSWGFYWRTDVRLGDGTRLAPVPIRRYRCLGECGTFSRLPTFLCRYLHSLADVVRAAFEDYVQCYPLKEIPLGMDGPAFHTVYRWLSMLRCSRIGAWLEEKALALRRYTPLLGIKNLVTRRWALAKSIASDTNSPAALVQWANLRHLIRYGSSTYNNF